jgi:hypothetical protein
MLILATSFLPAQQSSFRVEEVYGRQAYVIENGKLRLSALRGGGHVSEFRLLSDDPKLSLNPLYVPEYQTIEPYEYDQAKHGGFYGTGANRYLDAGYIGHLLCFPSFGPTSSEDEIRNGLGFHGEALAVEWTQPKPPQIDSGGVTLFYSAELPHSQYRVERAIHVPAGTTVAHVEEWIENLADYDRPFNRNQHATFGAPFVANGKNFLDLSGTKGTVDRGRTAGINWPNATTADGASLDLRPYQRDLKTSVFRAILVDPSRPTGYFTMYNPDYSILVGYVFPTADNPWICDWQENQSAQDTPRAGKMIARGIEFGTSPLDEGIRGSVERGSLFGAPTYRWINGRQRLKTTYTIFLAQIPDGFAGVADVQLEPGQIVITERDTKRQISLPDGDRP